MLKCIWFEITACLCFSQFISSHFHRHPFICLFVIYFSCDKTIRMVNSICFNFIRFNFNSLVVCLLLMIFIFFLVFIHLSLSLSVLLSLTAFIRLQYARLQNIKNIEFLTSTSSLPYSMYMPFTIYASNAVPFIYILFCAMRARTKRSHSLASINANCVCLLFRFSFCWRLWKLYAFSP